MLLFFLIILLINICAYLLIRNIFGAFKNVYGTKYYNGPVHARDQRALNLQGIHNILEDHPNFLLQRVYPGIAKSAEATRRYKELNKLYENGKIDIIDFNLQLKEILPLIDISEIITNKEKKKKKK